MQTVKPVKRTLRTLRGMKDNGEKIAMVTAYDYPSAKLADEAGVDVLLVGDSLGMVVLGYESTLPVTLEEMVHHTKAVTRGAKRAFVVADLPFLTYHLSEQEALHSAGRLMQEGLSQGVKMEGGREIVPQVRKCVQAGIPVMGHLGLTPQSVHQLGGYRVQGRNAEATQGLLDDALALQEAGIFALVLECVPEESASWITKRLSVPTIGIGAGRGVDGQVLVFHDLLQYASNGPKFVKSYASIGDSIREALQGYVSDVKESAFPAEENVFHLEPSESARLGEA